MEEYRARPGQSHVVGIGVGRRYGSSNFVQTRAEDKIDENLMVQKDAWSQYNNSCGRGLTTPANGRSRKNEKRQSLPKLLMQREEEAVNAAS